MQEGFCLLHRKCHAFSCARNHIWDRAPSQGRGNEEYLRSAKGLPCHGHHQGKNTSKAPCHTRKRNQGFKACTEKGSEGRASGGEESPYLHSDRIRKDFDRGACLDEGCS